MKNALLVVILAAGVPLAAQSWEVSSFVGSQRNRSSDYSLPGGGEHIAFDPNPKTVSTLRVAYSLLEEGRTALQVSAAWQPEVSTAFHVTATGRFLSYPTTDEVKMSQVAFGAMLNIKAFATWGAGLDYRSERLFLDHLGDTGNVSYGRFWARANMAMTLEGPVLQPFVGFEIAAPLAHTSADAQHISRETVVRSLAPSLQLGIYLGIRF